MYHRDWYMRQIELLTKFIARMLGHKDDVVYIPAQGVNSTDHDRLYLKLCALIDEKKINEAETLLFEHIEHPIRESRGPDAALMMIATVFYKKLNDLDDATLQAAEFTREEIEQGLKDAASRIGYKIFDSWMPQ